MNNKIKTFFVPLPKIVGGHTRKQCFMFSDFPSVRPSVRPPVVR